MKPRPSSSWRRNIMTAGGRESRVSPRSRGQRRRRILAPTAGVAEDRSRLAAVIAAILLILQLLAAPYHQALAVGAGPANAAIAAELKATFGEAATLCGGDDKGGPASPGGDCDDRCPFCRLAAQTVALIAPDRPTLRAQVYASGDIVVAAPETGAIPVPPTKRSRARAPPLAV
jgi:hypothetical protein